MEWVVAITTVRQRFAGLLPRTFASLKAAGFDDIWIAVDGPEPLPPDVVPSRVIHRASTLGAYGHWLLTLWEMYLLQPFADRYAIFQDDVVAYRHLRAYLDRCDYPRKGYWNLYTFPENQRKQPGWWRAKGWGRGAVALAFSRKAVEELLSAEHLVKACTHSKGGRVKRHLQNIDGGVYTAMEEVERREWVHNPTLVNHVGMQSTLGHKQYPATASFLGENFDARELLI